MQSLAIAVLTFISRFVATRDAECVTDKMGLQTSAGEMVVDTPEFDGSSVERFCEAQ